MNHIIDLQKLIKLTGDRIMLDAKANETCIVYKTKESQIVKEYYNGKIVPVSKQDVPHA